jgi:hypothetical protein
MCYISFPFLDEANASLIEPLYNNIILYILKITNYVTIQIKDVVEVQKSYQDPSFFTMLSLCYNLFNKDITLYIISSTQYNLPLNLSSTIFVAEKFHKKNN